MRRTHWTRAAALAAVLALALPTGARAHDVACASATATGGDWPLMGGDVTGSRNQEKERFVDGLAAAQLSPAWVFDANRASLMPNNEITGYPIVAGGCVYVGSSLATFGTTGWVFGINAETGELVWRHKTKGGVYNSVAYASGVVYSFVSRVGSPYVVALNAADGSVLWETTVDHQIGSDAVSSPIVFDGLVWVGISGTAAEVNEGDRSTFQGNQVIIDAATGQLLRKTYTIPEELWEAGFSGGAVWSTIAVDPETKYGYVGTGNPFDYENEHERTNALLKVDMDRDRATFGEIVGSYKGTIEEYVPELADTIPCQEMEEISGVFALGLECLRLDLDFGAMPNLVEIDGESYVASGQKSGVFHVVDADTMGRRYTQLLGAPSAVGGIVGSAAFDGEAFYGPHTLGGYLWSVDKEAGDLRWVAPVGSGVNWGPPATYANRVVYTVDLAGFLDAFDSGTGLPLLRRPLLLGDIPGTAPFGGLPITGDRPQLTWGGVTVARGTVYVSVGVGLTSAGMPSLPGGYVIAYEPARVGV